MPIPDFGTSSLHELFDVVEWINCEIAGEKRYWCIA